jgi:hypothetical protein
MIPLAKANRQNGAHTFAGNTIIEFFPWYKFMEKCQKIFMKKLNFFYE